MSKLSRTDRYRALREENSRISEAASQAEASSSKMVRKAAPDLKSEAKREAADSSSEVLTSLLGEVTQYNIESGEIITDDPQLQILHDLTESSQDDSPRNRHLEVMEANEAAGGTTLNIYASTLDDLHKAHPTKAAIWEKETVAATRVETKEPEPAASEFSANVPEAVVMAAQDLAIAAESGRPAQETAEVVETINLTEAVEMAESADGAGFEEDFDIIGLETDKPAAEEVKEESEEDAKERQRKKRKERRKEKKKKKKLAMKQKAEQQQEETQEEQAKEPASQSEPEQEPAAVESVSESEDLELFIPTASSSMKEETKEPESNEEKPAPSKRLMAKTAREEARRQSQAARAKSAAAASEASEADDDSQDGGSVVTNVILTIAIVLLLVLIGATVYFMHKIGMF